MQKILQNINTPFTQALTKTSHPCVIPPPHKVTLCRDGRFVPLLPSNNISEAQQIFIKGAAMEHYHALVFFLNEKRSVERGHNIAQYLCKVVSTVASQQEGPRFKSRSGHFCAGFACSFCVGFPWILRLPHTFQKHTKIGGKKNRLNRHQCVPIIVANVRGKNVE